MRDGRGAKTPESADGQMDARVQLLSILFA